MQTLGLMAVRILVPRGRPAPPPASAPLTSGTSTVAVSLAMGCAYPPRLDSEKAWDTLARPNCFPAICRPSNHQLAVVMAGITAMRRLQLYRYEAPVTRHR